MKCPCCGNEMKELRTDKKYIFYKCMKCKTEVAIPAE